MCFHKHRRERQEDLVKAKNQETLNRLTAAKDGGGPEASTSGRKVGHLSHFFSFGFIE